VIDVPMPIHTARLMIRPRKPGDGEFALAAIRETWDELHRWMWWAENLDQFTSEQLEMRNRQCDTGFWVRRSAQGRNIATESTNAMLRYAFGALGMCRVGLTHSDGNEASCRIAEKLGFVRIVVERAANHCPAGLWPTDSAMRRFGSEGLPPLDVHWGKE
jgi:RimJ/RimL family protein N-acetyltransferase